MPIKTNLNRSPYFNDYDPKSEYYEHLFKPSVSVQVRELNGIQSYLQNQIEKFGDNIFKSGTIVSGCNFAFYPKYNFVKLSDTNIDGIGIEASLYNGMFLTNIDNLKAYVINYQDGFESGDPNLKTLFVNYVNSGDSGNTAFAAGDELTVDNGKDSIFSVDINDGSIGFTNSDSVVFSASIEVNVTAGTFSNGDYISDIVIGSNAQIISITTSEINNNAIFTLKPLTSDLANASGNNLAWTFTKGNDVQNSGNTASGSITRIFGKSAAAKIITNGIGKVTSVVMTDYGEGYEFNPHVTIRSANNSSGIDALDLSAVTYYDKIYVTNLSSPVGNGYAFGVTDGIIYQAGHFLKVNSQIVIVNSYSSTPNNVSVGFKTEEAIVNYLANSALLDNALGTRNETAPGADRLKLTPVLTVVQTANALSNSEFLSLVEWNDGNPYKQTQVSVYSKIGDEMARRMDDSSGNFVLDPFLVTTAHVANSQLEGSYYTAVVDPGEGYVDGYHTRTLRNFKVDVPKATETRVSTDRSITLNYDAYIRVNEVGGLFQFSTGDTVSLYDTEKTFLSNTSLITSGNTTPQGTEIGTARIRSMVLENGYAGDSNAVYRLYLFNISMNPGKSFRNIKSVYYDGTNKGICDAVLEQDATTAQYIAILNDAQNDALVFPTGAESIRNTNNTTYVYRTIDQITATANAGTLTKSIASNPNEFYPYSSTLSDADMRDLYVVPIGNNLIAYTAHTGTVDCNTSSPNVIGSSTTFINDLVVGDYIRIGNDVSSDIKQVVNIVNNTYLVLDSNCSFANSSGSTWRAFPQYAPIPFGSRDGLTGNVDANGNILTLDFGMTFEGTVTVNTALGVSIRRTDVSSTAKTCNREKYVKLQLSNNAATNAGPWCLGVPDVFRLRNVYYGNSSVNTSFTDVGEEFFVDANHKSNYVDLSYLHINPKSTLALTTDDYLLVCFDYFTRADDGYFDTVSYLGTSNAEQIAALDSLPLANLTSAASSWEVPEFYSAKGKYYDLLNTLDFRPAVVNTVTVGATYGAAPTNPPYELSFGNTADPANDKKFPLPDSSFITTIEEYKGRTDVTVVGSDGFVTVQQGTASTDATKRYAPQVSSDSMTLNKLHVPPYPNICVNLSNTVLDIIDTSVHTKGQIGTRLLNHTVRPIVANTQTSVPSQPKGYNMAQIGQLERRIRDLEFYTSLSLLETSITNKIIPSSVDGSLNRFKFGFTADDFSTRLYSDTTNPQYSAEIELADNIEDTRDNLPTLATNLCVPPKLRWTLKHEMGYDSPFIDFTIMSQPLATDSRDHIQPLCSPITTVTQEDIQVEQINTYYISVNTVVNTYTQTVGHTFSQDTSVTRVELNDADAELTCMVSANSGPMTLFFRFGTNVQPSGDPYIEIFQSNTQYGTGWDKRTSSATLVQTSANAAALSGADKNYLIDRKTANSQVYSWWRAWRMNVQYGTFRKYANNWVEGIGKIDFTHNPALGRYYYCDFRFPRITGNIRSYNYTAMMRYPIDQLTQTIVTTNVAQTEIYYITETITNTIIDPCGTTGTTGSYTGTMSASYARNSVAVPNGTREFDSVLLVAHGLLPSTTHNLYVNGVLDATDVRPLGGVPGEALVSGPDGTIIAVYNLRTTNWEEKQRELGLLSSGSNSELILNEGNYVFAEDFHLNEYISFEILGPNSGAGSRLYYVPWSSY